MGASLLLSHAVLMGEFAGLLSSWSQRWGEGALSSPEDLTVASSQSHFCPKETGV